MQPFFLVSQIKEIENCEVNKMSMESWTIL